MFAGFFQSVCVIQPIKAVIVAVLFAAIFRKPVDEKQPKEEDLLPKPDKKKSKKKKDETSVSWFYSLLTFFFFPLFYEEFLKRLSIRLGLYI